jgi:hypothetical protein
VLLSISSADARVIGRGLAVLALAVAVGVAAADSQLNRLTARSDFSQALAVRRDAAGYYRAYLLGQSWAMRAAYPLGTVAGGNGKLTVAVAGRSVTVSTVARVELAEAEYWLGVWRRQFVAAAMGMRAELAGYAEELRPLVRKIIDAVKR